MASKKVSMNIEAEAGAPKDHITFKDGDYGERHFVREGQGYKEVTKPAVVPVRTHQDRGYIMRDTESFIAYVGKYGNPAKGIISAEQKDALIRMFFDEASRTEIVELPFKSSLELVSFLGGTGASRTFSQKDLVKMLETFPDVVEGSKTLLPNIERLKIETAVNFESNTDERDYTFLYKEKEGSQTSRIPKQLWLNLPYFEGSTQVTTICVDLEIHRPKSAEEKPLFILRDPRQPRTHRDAFKGEIEIIKAALPKWQFVWGSLI